MAGSRQPGQLDETLSQKWSEAQVQCLALYTVYPGQQ